MISLLLVTTTKHFYLLSSGVTIFPIRWPGTKYQVVRLIELLISYNGEIVYNSVLPPSIRLFHQVHGFCMKCSCTYSTNRIQTVSALLGTMAACDVSPATTAHIISFSMVESTICRVRTSKRKSNKDT